MQKGEWAVVTGASTGMGKAFAEQLAAKGLNLFLIALEAGALSKQAETWHAQYQIQVHWLAVDLSEPGVVREILADIEEKNLDVSLLLNAAGFGYFGDFLSMTTEQIQKMVKVNVLAVLELCHGILPKLKARGGGTLMNIASIAGHLPYPYAAVYSGSKSMVHFFTRALWSENQDPKIKILSLSPGHTKTNFDNVSKEPDSIHLFPDEDPEQIAKTTLERLSPKRCTVFTRPTHPLKVLLARLLPIKWFAWMLRGLAGKKIKEKEPVCL